MHILTGEAQNQFKKIILEKLVLANTDSTGYKPNKKISFKQDSIVDMFHFHKQNYMTTYIVILRNS